FSVDPSALAVAAVSERRVAQGRALYTKRSPAELYRGARSSARERYARSRGPRKFALANFWGEPASRLGAERPFPAPACVMQFGACWARMGLAVTYMGRAWWRGGV